jgi:hypothetical protein
MSILSDFKRLAEAMEPHDQAGKFCACPTCTSNILRAVASDIAERAHGEAPTPSASLESLQLVALFGALVDAFLLAGIDRNTAVTTFASAFDMRKAFFALEKENRPVHMRN